MMQYKGYIGQVEFDDEADEFFGEVINTRDVITFVATTVEGLRTEFRNSVDDYLAFCANLGREPEKPCSGQFMTRLDPALHRRIQTAAFLAKMSLNSWVAAQLERAVSPAAPAAKGRKKATRSRPVAKKVAS